MTPTINDFYSQWLEDARRPTSLFEGGFPPERWLQHLWRHQRIVRDQLHLIDGRSLHVLHPGFWNCGPGPDFRGAILQFDDHPPVQGDVEIDLIPSGWITHRHQGNPAYRAVILHALWEPGIAHGPLPTLNLSTCLDAPLPDLIPWLQGEAPGLIPANVRGGCCAPLRRLSPASLEAVLLQAAEHRLTRKAGEILHRARQLGWERALWEGLLAGLGYRHNTWPLRRLAELLIPNPDSPFEGVIDAQAQLLGLAGFLPAHLDGSNASFHRELWDRWWREGGRHAGKILPRETWRLSGLRPANHPHRRLALAAHWLASGSPGPALVEAILGARDTADAVERAHAVLQPGNDPFWDGHWTLHSEPSRTGPLLGRPRVTDLTINMILPWLWARAGAGGTPEVREIVRRRFFEWPAGEDNAVLKMARHRLLGGEPRLRMKTAAIQQGFLQIAADFCDASNALCEGCGFPRLIAAWEQRGMLSSGPGRSSTGAGGSPG